MDIFNRLLYIEKLLIKPFSILKLMLSLVPKLILKILFNTTLTNIIRTIMKYTIQIKYFNIHDNHALIFSVLVTYILVL